MTQAWTPKKKFDYVFNKATSLLILRGIGELRGPIQKLPRHIPLPRALTIVTNIPLPKPITDLLIKLKEKVGEWANVVDNSLNEMILVQCVTALEVYLEEVYQVRRGEPWGRKRKLENAAALVDWSGLTGLDPFKGQSWVELQSVFQMRHVIIHKGGIIDQQALDQGLGTTAVVGQPMTDYLTLVIITAVLGKVSMVVSSVEAQLR